MKIRSIIGVATAAAAMLAAAGSAFAQQASLTLRGCDTGICNHNDTAWELTKSGVYQQVGLNVGVGTVTWTVTATRGATSDKFIDVNGVVTIENTGSANATLGNIVVNLQKRAVYPAVGGQPTWVSAAADMADATVGSAATKANIAAAASQESAAANAAVGANNYTTPGGGKGVFVKTAGSGTVEFTDATDNTAWALVPAKVIPPGGLVTLKYTATFNNTILGIADGAQIRSEAIVTFGNAGGRGDSGASSPNIDINGSGVLDADEAHVRSVPCRVSKDLPALEKCNDTVILTDTDPDSLSTTGTAAWTGFTTDIGLGTGIEVISATTTRSVSVTVAGGLDGGDVCNTAGLLGESDSVTAGGFTFECCKGVELTALSCVTIPNEIAPCTDPSCFPPGLSGCTFTQGGWGAEPHGNNVAALLYLRFSTVYPSGQVVIGGAKTVTFKTKTTVVNGTAQNLGSIPAGAYDIVSTGLSNPKYTYKIGVTKTALQAITAFLPAGGTPGALDNNLENPTSTSAGVFAGQVLALKLNVDFGAAGWITPIGGYTICNTGTAADGQTIVQVLAAANVALGGGALPYGMTDISQLEALVDNINNAFDNCVADDWAKSYVCP